MNERKTVYVELPEIGSIWMEDDARFARRIEVVAIEGDRAVIQTVHLAEGVGWVPVDMRRTRAKLSRFNAPRGYKPIQIDLG